MAGQYWPRTHFVGEVDPSTQKTPRSHTTIVDGSEQNEPPGHRTAYDEFIGQYCPDAQAWTVDGSGQNEPLGHRTAEDELAGQYWLRAHFVGEVDPSMQ